MGALRNVIIAILLVSLITFVALFGQIPALRKTPIGWLQRILCLHMPNGLRRVDSSLTGGRITRRTERLGQYLFYEQNPVVLNAYLTLLTSSAILFLYNAVPHLPTSLLLPLLPLLPAPYALTYLCATHKTHYITPQTHAARMHDYPYDHILFPAPPRTCATCNLPKPARSKHCSLCGVCVAKHDHHCPWVNTCLGRGNYRSFLALLLSLSSLQTYGAYLAYHILRAYCYFDAATPLFSRAKLAELGRAFVVAVNTGGLSIAGVGLLAVSTAALPLGLLAYHVYLIWAGMTTNEAQKWADWREDMAEGIVFKAHRGDLRAWEERRRERSGCQDPMPGSLAFDDDGEFEVPWPVSSDEILVCTSNGQPPAGQERLWTRIWKLDDVTNVYDLGGWGNLMEILRGR